MGAPAARVTDVMADGGSIIGPGDATVLLGGLPATVLGDSLTWPAGQSTATFTIGSTTVLIGGKPAIRVGDVSSGGTSAVVGSPTVLIG
jgi:uncharacterized Zn-binding protein involved in type VI secretion